MLEAGRRRDRLRAATEHEMVQTARRILARGGTEAVSLRGVAREMGLSAPALYRYVDSREQMLSRVADDIFAGLTDDLRNVMEGASRSDVSERFMAACRKFRQWVLVHNNEFRALLGEAGHGGVFVILFEEPWRHGLFPVAPDELHLLDCWVVLHGFVLQEANGHLLFATRDATPIFERLLAEIVSRLGLEVY